MKSENIYPLEKLGLYCHLCGLFSVFLGLVVAFMDLMNSGLRHVPVGLYVFMTGYALVKISSKISEILISENAGEGKPHF